MKKIFSILMVALMATAIVSCNKDDDSSSSTGGNGGGNSQYAQWLVGTWLVDYASFNGTEETPQNMRMEFYSNGTGLMNDNGETLNNEFGWSIAGNAISITIHSGKTLNFTITQMTENEATFTGTSMPGREEEGAVVFRIVKVNNGGEDPVEAAANTLVMNGVTYHLVSTYTIGYEGRSYASANTVELDENGESVYFIIADIEAEDLNHTYHFGNPAELGNTFFFIRDANYFIDYSDDSEIGPADFTSGTVTVSRNDNLFEYKVAGIAKGKSISFTMSVPASEWDVPQN